MTVVNTGMMGALAKALREVMGREVIVHRSTHYFKKPGAKGLTPVTKYALFVNGCNPECYFGLTVNEVKARMAMLLDLIYSGAFIPVSASGEEIRPTGGRPDIAPDPADASGGISPLTGGLVDEAY